MMADDFYKDTKLVGIDERGNRVGEDHPRAKLTDDEVELIRELAEPSDGAKPLSMRVIAEKFECSAGTVCDIVNFKKRATYPVGWRRVRIVVAGRELVRNMSEAKRKPVRHEPGDND